MKTINIFIGSSFHLSQWRCVVGEAVRLSTDKWEPYGIRIQLKNWEEHYSYYAGKSKQDEYIDDLVLPSQLCVFVFANEIGIYTKKELIAKIAQDKDAIVTYCVPTYEGAKDRNTGKKLTEDEKHTQEENVKVELNGMGLNFNFVPTEDELLVNLMRRVDDYIETLKLAEEERPLRTPSLLYTTIPSDVIKEQYAFGNAIRAVDDMADAYFNHRCRLLPRNHHELMNSADYYTPLLKNETSNGDVQEFEEALDLLNKHHKPYINIFTKGNIYENNEDIKKLVAGKDIFTVSAKNMEVVKTKVFSWLLKNAVGVLPTNDNSCTILDDIVYYNRFPLANIMSFDPSGELKKINDSVANSKTVLDKATSSGDIKAKYYKRTYDSQKAQLLLRLNQTLSDWMYDEVVNDIDDENIEITHIQELNNAIESEEQLLVLQKNNENEILEKWKRSADQLYIKQKELMSYTDAVDFFQNIIKVAKTREDILEKLVKYRYVSPIELCKAQLNMVGIYDTYGNFTTIPEDEDELYVRIVNNADQNAIKTPAVECIRLNVGNKFWRKNDYPNGAICFDKAIENLMRFDLTKPAIRHYVSHAFISAIQLYLEFGNKEGVERWINVFYDLTSAWLKEGNGNILYYAQCLFCKLAYLDISDDDNALIQDAEKTFNAICSVADKLIMNETEQFEILCYLPNMIARYYIDHEAKSTEEQKQYNDTALKYIDIAFSNLEKIKKLDSCLYIFYMGELYHQKAFLISSFGFPQCMQARDLYDKALEYRNKHYEITQEHRTSIAQTYVNMGAFEEGLLRAYVLGMLKAHGKVALRDPIFCVDKAEEIYKAEYVPGSPESEQRLIECDLLRGTSIYFLSKTDNDKYSKDDAIKILKKCWDWNSRHKGNSYRYKIQTFAGEILKAEGLI